VEANLKKKQLLLIFGITLLISVLAVPFENALAGAPAKEATPGVADSYCLSCHDTPGFRTTLSSGEELYIGVDAVMYYESTHGSRGYACVQCHTEIKEYPHPENTATTVREYNLANYETCRQCHEDKFEATLDSTHQKSLADGNMAAAVCTDCHGIHDIHTPSENRADVPLMCEKCHSEIYNLYEESVHGAALFSEDNQDVPTCTDCHGVHNVTGPTAEGSFHLFSPQICADCHANEEMMMKYNVSTNVFDTYLSDFHGTTVVLFEQIAPDQETNKPVCIDCHGVHNMRKVDDPESTVIKENLLTTCQKCHPDATENFPTSWLGHYEPSSEDTPVIFFIDMFYKIVIPTTIGGMLIYIASDVGKKFFNKRSAK